MEFTTELLDGATDADYSLDDDPDAHALTLTFEEGEEEQSFTFKSLTDNDDDDGETVTITFVDSMTSPLPDRVTEGTTNEAVVTIKPLPVTPPPGGGGGGGGGPPPAPVPSEADFEWNVTRDIEALDKDNDLPTDLWSDGQTIWVLNNAGSGADSIFAYDLAIPANVKRPVSSRSTRATASPTASGRTATRSGSPTAARTCSSPTTSQPASGEATMT